MTGKLYGYRYIAIVLLTIWITAILSCAGKPVTAEKPNPLITGVWIRSDDAAAGTSIMVIQSNGLFYGYLMDIKGVLKNKFFSNECKWMGLTQTGKMEWTGQDLYRLVKIHHSNSQIAIFGNSSNEGYLPCQIVLSGANTLYLQSPPPEKLPYQKDTIDFSITLPAQKWIKITEGEL